MGIDIHARFDGQTEDQMYAARKGAEGYLRESYHGGPYVTRYLLEEAFGGPDDSAAIPTKVLRERLPVAVLLATYREHIVYGEADKPPGNIEIGDGDLDVIKVIGGIFNDIDPKKVYQDIDTIRTNITPEQVRQARHLIAKRELSERVLEFVDFVDFCVAKEGEMGKPCVIEASY